MSFGGGGHQGGRTRMVTNVILNVYDLAPANEVLYPIGFGLHHSGVEILGTEYSFASGGGIFESTPKVAPGAKFRTSIEMGAFDGGISELQRAIGDLREDFRPDNYNLIRRNCNNFANALLWALLGKPIPAHINRLADLGVCCSCLLPKRLLEHAPVGDTRDTSASGSSGGGRAYRPGASTRSVPTTTSFVGSGHKLGGTEASSTRNGRGAGGGLTGSLIGSASSTRQDDLTDRRERARGAALARMELISWEQQKNANDSDKSC